MDRLERRAGMDDDLLSEATKWAYTEALKRVTDEDLGIMAAIAERMPEATSEEFYRTLDEEAPGARRRFEELYRETGEEMARGR